MGISSVLLIWTIGGIVFATAGGLALRGLTQFVTRGAKRGRAKTITASTLFPFACVGWAGTMFLLQVFVSQNLLHRDPGIGDTRYCSLPNGYSVLMKGVTDHGWVFDPKIQPGDTDGRREDAIANVRTMQVAGRYILGAADSQAAGHGADHSRVDSFFLFDTEAGRHMTFSRSQALIFQARQLGIEPNLESIHDAYARYRFSWFDVLAVILLVLPPAAGAYSLAGWIVKVRKSRPVARPILQKPRRVPIEIGTRRRSVDERG